MPYKEFKATGSVENGVFSDSSLGYADIHTVSGDLETLRIVENYASGNIQEPSKTGNIRLQTVYENGENLGLVQFTNVTFTGIGGVARYLGSGIPFMARQTGFQSETGISFQIDRTLSGFTSTGFVNYPSPNYLYVSAAPLNSSPSNPEFPRAGAVFTLASNGSLGSFPNEPLRTLPCYATGTLILTERGDVVVETLSVADVVVTASGAHRPIRWIGRRHLDCSRHPQPKAVWPVRILAGAFAEGLPRRDLWLSPDHAVRVSVLDEVLIPIKHLLNDATIAQVETADVTYWHVELDSHDILLAEGLPAESFLDTGVRAGFENGAEHMVLHPNFSPLALDAFCRPLVQEGPIVDAVRLRLLARASELGWTLTSEDDLRAVVDGAVVYPEREGAVARFAIPADATEIRLHSRSFVPERVRVGAGDGRRLGVPVCGLSVVDGAGVTRLLPIASEALSRGFSFVQGEADRPWRWTTGEAVVPPILWAGTEGGFSLVVELAPEEGALQAWQAPALVTSHEASEASLEAATAFAGRVKVSRALGDKGHDS